MLERLRTPSRVTRRNRDASSSLTSIDSASGSLRALQSLPGAIRQSESADSSGPTERNESERSLPATLQTTRQCECRVFSYQYNPFLPPWIATVAPLVRSRTLRTNLRLFSRVSRITLSAEDSLCCLASPGYRPSPYLLYVCTGMVIVTVILCCDGIYGLHQDSDAR